MSLIPTPRTPVPALPPAVEIVVVGGGVMGAATAWQLARRGHEVLLLEQFGPGHDRGASHGTSRIYRLTYSDPRYVRLAAEALELWRELEHETGAGLLTFTGGVDHGDPDSTGPLAASLAAHGIAYEWLDPQEAAERWPGRVFEGRVLHQPDRSGRVHADQAVAAFGAAAVGWGAVVRHRVAVEALEIGGDDRVDVRTTAGTVRARRVVVTAGAWSAGLTAGLIPLPALRVTQERPVHVVRRPGVPSGPTFIHHVTDGWPSSVYGLAAPDGRVKLGFHGVGRLRDPDAAPPPADARTARLLLDYIDRYLPGLDGSTAETVECTYTSTPDAEFALVAQGPLTVGAGFSGHGFKFAPAIGRVLADMATDATAVSPVGPR
ncbi:N-methyl-L-tryptophan oxidase [Pseudonocardia ailaonensis]|uniref:N-methyl-L-tryptophan oxidase n=1 Tax=Pseudonocardia ailaonensis TaxID=367279 RepID=A0ABN2N5T5_9PSEU